MRTDAVRNDRAIELSEWSHAELALYARALEIDRRQLIELTDLMKRELGALHRHEGMPAQLAGTIERLLSVLDQLR